MFLDGSGIHANTSGARRTGFGVAAFRAGTVDLLAEAYGAVPVGTLLQTVPAAETYAVLFAVKSALPPFKLHIDNSGVISHLQRGRTWATRAQNPLAAWWAQIWLVLDDLGEGQWSFIKVKMGLYLICLLM